MSQAPGGGGGEKSAVMLDTKQKISNNKVLLTAGNTQLEHMTNLAIPNLPSNSFYKCVQASLPKHRST